LSAYYCEKYLPKRLENLLSQSLVPEIVIIYQKDSPEHRIMSEMLIGKSLDIQPCQTTDIPTVYEAWNFGIKFAHGEYLTSANSDDLFYEGAIEKLAAALDKEKHHAMAYANVDRIKDWDEPKTIGRFEWAEGGLKELYWTGCFLGPMPMWRKSLHEKYGPFDGEMHSAGDYEFWLRLAAGLPATHVAGTGDAGWKPARDGEKFFHIREVLGAHLEREDSLEHRSGLRSTWEQARARAKYRQAAGDLPVAPR
jgi:hypothetical protein